MPVSPPDPTTLAGHAYHHAQTARSMAIRAAANLSDPAGWDKAKIYALVSIAESLATLAANQTTQISGSDM